jgi:nitrogen-specific signal transduction histidine kinase
MRILSEAQVLQGQKKLQAVFDGISEPLTFVDSNMTTQMVNEAAVRYYQYPSPQDILGRSNCIQLGVKKDLCDRCPIPTAVSGDKQVCFVREGYIDPERVESVTIFPISAEHEEYSGAVIRISDITEARMMEKALLRSENLASIGVLSSGVAHEINNPNNFIMFNIPVLRRYLGACPWSKRTRPPMQPLNRS